MAGSSCLLISDLVSDLGLCVDACFVSVFFFFPSGSVRNLCVVAVVIFDIVDSDVSARSCLVSKCCAGVEIMIIVNS